LVVVTVVASVVAIAPRLSQLAAAIGATSEGVTVAISVVATAPRLSQLAVGIGAGQGTDGSTTQIIAAGPRIETGRPRTSLGDQHGAAHCPSARRLRGNSLGGKAATWRATALEEGAWAIGAAAPASAIERAEAERTA
jgi:hypothetical protein